MKKTILKFLSITFAFAFIFFANGCEQEFDLSNYVTEVRQDVFEGKKDNYHLKAGYSFKENQNLLNIKLVGKYDQNVTYLAKVTINQTEYKQAFSYNPVSCSLTTCFNVDSFNLKTFDVTIVTGSINTVVTLNSVLPQNTMDYKTALNYLYINQPDLINSYFDNDGNFTATIIVRAIVKNDHPYWYVGLKNQNSNLKALLIDGVSGEVLAIRDIF